MKLDELLRDGQAELLEVWAGVLAALGAERVLRAPLIEPSLEQFPDPYEPSLVGMGRLLYRLLALAGLGEHEVEIVDARTPFEQSGEIEVAHRSPSLSFLGMERGRLLFQVERLGALDVTAAALCHEVAAAALSLAQTGGEANAERAAAATIALGFGLLTYPAALGLRWSSQLTGHSVQSRQSVVLVGALPPGDLGFLMATFLVLRGATVGELERRYLGDERAGEVTRWVEALAPLRQPLREKLRLPWSDERPAPRPVPPGKPLSPERLKPLEAAEAAYRQPHEGQVAMRLYDWKTLQYGLVAGLLSLVPMILLSERPELLWAAWIPPLVFIVGGALLGRRSRSYSCGACNMHLHAHENVCSKCGARIEGERELAPRPHQLPDDEDDDDELTKEALAAAPIDEDSGD